METLREFLLDLFAEGQHNYDQPTLRNLPSYSLADILTQHEEWRTVQGMMNANGRNRSVYSEINTVLAQAVCRDYLTWELDLARFFFRIDENIFGMIRSYMFHEILPERELLVSTIADSTTILRMSIITLNALTRLPQGENMRTDRTRPVCIQLFKRAVRHCRILIVLLQLLDNLLVMGESDYERQHPSQ